MQPDNKSTRPKCHVDVRAVGIAVALAGQEYNLEAFDCLLRRALRPRIHCFDNCR